MSLHARLAVLIALALAAAVVAQSVLGLLEFQRVIYRDLDGDLNQFLGSIAGQIESFDDLKALDSSYENYVTRARIVDGTKVLALLGGDFPSTKDAITALPSSQLGWRFASLALPGLGAKVRIEGAINSQRDERSLEQYRHTALMIALSFSGLGVMLALFLSTKALQPLDHLLATISKVANSGNLGLRVPSSGPPELMRLSDGFNQMLERLQTHRQRETEFTRHASHELRTPLTAIGLEIGAYREGISSAEDALTAIEHEAKRMRRLSEALLILAREDKPEMQHFDLGQLLQACATRAGLPFSGLAKLTMLGNRALIERAIENLIENAKKYAPKSAIEVRLESDLLEVFTICVIDQGPGMDQRTLERATELFYRASSTQSNGSGVGLSVVKRIAEAHGGQILLENAWPGLIARLVLPLEQRSWAQVDAKQRKVKA